MKNPVMKMMKIELSQPAFRASKGRIRIDPPIIPLRIATTVVANVKGFKVKSDMRCLYEGQSN